MTASIDGGHVVLRDHLLVGEIAVADARVDAHSRWNPGSTQAKPGLDVPVSLPSVNLSATSHWLITRIRAQEIDARR